MHNVYTFNAMAVSNKDRRVRSAFTVSADAETLSKAWDKAERKAEAMYPDYSYCLSLGNRQPMHLRQSAKDFKQTIGEILPQLAA